MSTFFIPIIIRLNQNKGWHLLHWLSPSRGQRKIPTAWVVWIKVIEIVGKNNAVKIWVEVLKSYSNFPRFLLLLVYMFLLNKFVTLHKFRQKTLWSLENYGFISETTAAPEVTDQKGDFLIWDLWQQGTESVHGMRVVNTDALAYLTKAQEKCLHEAEKGKKKIYLEACLQQRRHFSPFVASVDGLLGVKVTATLKRIASRLATKWKQPY